MSILIEPTDKQETDGFNNSTLTSDPSGPDQFWAGLRLACPVWKTKDLGTTGGGSIFGIGEEYVTGYLVPKLNGVAQDPTRFTETDKELGTFTFDVAPDSGWGITVDYGVYCDEDLGLHTPTEQGRGLPKASKIGAGIGVGSGVGARVVIAGRTTTTPRFGFTNNIYAASPAWTSNTTGLPASVSAVKLLRLYSFDPSNVAIMVLEQGTSGDEVWRNTNYDGGGSWAKIFDLTNTTYAGAADDFTIADISYTIADPSRINIYWGASGVGFGTSCSHSHDNGTTWTNVNIHATQPVSLNQGSLSVGQHNADKVWIANPQSSAPDSLFRSSDGGHTWVQELLSADAGFSVAVPYASNAADSELFLIAGGSPGDIDRSTDSGDTQANWSTPTINSTIGKPSWNFSVLDSNIVWGINTTTFYKSVDKALTFTAYTIPVSVVAASLLGSSVWFAASVGPTVYTSNTGETGSWTARTGDLATTVFGGAAVSEIAGVIPDWTT